jgi:hypothetical protein
MLAAAAQDVVAVVRSEFQMHDTGDEPGQYGVDIKTGEGVSIALEVTSFGGEDWERTAARVRAERAKGNFAGKGLQHQWWVIFPPESECVTSRSR